MRTRDEFLFVIHLLLSMRGEIEIEFCEKFLLSILKQSLLEMIAVTLVEDMQENNGEVFLRFHQPLRENKLREPLFLLKNMFAGLFAKRKIGTDVPLQCDDDSDGWCLVKTGDVQTL